jgi:hypothetical protein
MSACNWLQPEEQAKRDARIRALTRAGYSTREIAAAVGVHERTVSRARVRTGVAQPANRPFTADDMRTAGSLLDDGASLSEVARTIGRDPITIRKYFPGCGWQRGSGIEYRRMIAALNAIPPNIVTLKRQIPAAELWPGHRNIALRNMYAAFHAIPDVNAIPDEVAS